MKKLIYTLCLFTGMAISSCEDWLARDPLDQIADVNLTYTADECKLYVNQFYTSFWGSPNNYIYHIDRGSDNLLSDNYQDNKDLIEGLHQVPSSGEGWGTMCQHMSLIFYEIHSIDRLAQMQVSHMQKLHDFPFPSSSARTARWHRRLRLPHWIL